MGLVHLYVRVIAQVRAVFTEMLGLREMLNIRQFYDTKQAIRDDHGV